jgi:hypothetical protein
MFLGFFVTFMKVQEHNRDQVRVLVREKMI